MTCGRRIWASIMSVDRKAMRPVSTRKAQLLNMSTRFFQRSGTSSMMAVMRSDLRRLMLSEAPK